MDFDTFITIVVFLVILFQFIKRRGAAKKTSSTQHGAVKKTRISGKTQTWRHKLEDTLSQIREELEKAQQAGTQTASEPEEADDSAIESSSSDVPKYIIPEKIDQPAPPSEKKTATRSMGYADVRNGIVWSEILGPPLAVRNEREEGSIR